MSQWRSISTAALLSTAIVLGVRYLGLLQGLEWAAYDHFSRWRVAKTVLPDDRIKIVTIDEADLRAGQQALISDRALAQALHNLAEQDPLVIGLDLYRDLPVPPGQLELAAALRTIPSLVGIQKVAEPVVEAPMVLEADGRAKANDLVVDGDNRIRRSFLFLIDDQGQIISGFAPYLALWFLEETAGIKFEKHSEDQWRLGAAMFKRFGAFDGGYICAHTGGFQLLIQYRGEGQPFETMPFREVLAGNLPPDWARDRIVLIGTTAESLNDYFFTPLSGSGSLEPPVPLSGVEINAHIIAQVLDAAMGKERLIQPVPEWVEMLWILVWSLLGATALGIGQQAKDWPLFPSRLQRGRVVLEQVAIALGLLGGLLLIGYLLFCGWALWLPVVPPALGFIAAGRFRTTHIANKATQFRLQNEVLNRLASIDGLTQVANRRSFDVYLRKAWVQAQQLQQPIALILCDVDYFKQYNDTYGHQEGDDCLRRVAYVLNASVTQPGSFVARYGGEEFAVILPGLEQTAIEAIACAIQQALRAEALPHKTSTVSDAVTLSLGIAIATPPLNDPNPDMLVECADDALYQAKRQGRDRYHCLIYGSESTLIQD
ncbi:MAG: CHASE2 domain-containing protein [Cyanobacteria bacterium P01_G01_bin.54]